MIYGLGNRSQTSKIDTGVAQSIHPMSSYMDTAMCVCICVGGCTGGCVGLYELSESLVIFSKFKNTGIQTIMDFQKILIIY